MNASKHFIKQLWRTGVSCRHLTSLTKETNIGIVGCGNVGTAVAKNLRKSGFLISSVYDINKSSMANVEGSDIRLCKSPREVAETCDIIISALPEPPHVRAAVEGPNGILSGLSEGKLWLDHSTTDPNQTIAYKEEVHNKSAGILEAPITGGMDALKKGQMVVYVGGDEALLDIVRPLLEASYKVVIHVGDIGSAMIVKVISNMLCCVNVLGMQEALMLAKRSGMDLRTFWNGIRLSAGNSFSFETAAPDVFSGGYHPWFTMALQCKDLQLGYEMSRKYKVPMDIHNFTHSIYRRTMYQYGDDAGCYSTPKTFEGELSESLQIPGFEKWNHENLYEDGGVIVKHCDIE